MTFKVCDFGSKRPYFKSSNVVRVPIFSFRTVHTISLSMVLCESREMYSMGGRKKKHRGVIDVEVPDIDKLPCE